MSAGSRPNGDEVVFWPQGRTARTSPDDREVWLFGGSGPVRLAGPAAGPLARAFDAPKALRTAVADAVGSGADRDDVDATAVRWLTAGHLTPWRAVDPEPASAVVIVERTGAEGGDGDALASALAAVGIDVRPVAGARRRDRLDRDALVVVVLDDLLAAEHAVDAIGMPAVCVCLRGDRAVVTGRLRDGGSPPTAGACPTCLVTRLGARRSAELVAAGRVGLRRPPADSVRRPESVAFAAAAIATAAGRGRPVPDASITVARDGLVQRHAVVPVAGCPRCDPDGPTVAMRHLAAGTGDDPAALVDTGGGFRTVDPEDTWDRYGHLVNDVVGVVPYVVAGEHPALRTYTAGLNAAAVDDVVAFRSRLRSLAGGKGITRSAARTGALAEALERTGLRARGGEPHRRARLRDLDTAIHPNEVELFSERQLRSTAALAALGVTEFVDDHGHHPVPLPFDVHAEHDWSPVADRRTGEVCWLPSSLLWFDWPGVPPRGWRGSSNGAATGNTLDEAVLQGLLELVERDSVALWWHPRCRRPAIDVDSWPDPRVQAALAQQRAQGAEVWVLDVTTDLGIPAAVAVARGLAASPDTPILGYGAHVDPALAATRALTELAQTQSVLARWPADRPRAGLGAAERIWLEQVTVEREPWLAPAGSVAPRDPVRYRDVRAAVDDVVDRIERAGTRVLWADCTRPDADLPLVRTFAPGLRHFWNRYGPGRLYTVPPALGWCAPGYDEADLNPLAMIL